MRHWMLIPFAAAALASAPAFAAPPPGSGVVEDCGDADSLTFAVEPWEANTRTFYAGQMRIVLIDTGGEPACCSAHLAVLYTEEPKDEPAYTACKMLSAQKGLGFAGVDFRAIKSTYDPKRGVLLTVPVSRMTDDGSSQTRSTVKVRLRMKPGSMTVER